MMRVVTLLAASLALASPTLVMAQEPVQNISRERHGNLAAAQDLIRQAFDRISDAQSANDDRLGGHASRAKDLLRQAADELRLAADVANNN
jgi:predicted lipoprotein with Yx(FWY)xxD motif